jgi:hypothetical protein
MTRSLASRDWEDIARLALHRHRRLALPAPIATSVSEEGNRGGEEAAQDGSAPSPPPGWVVPSWSSPSAASSPCATTATPPSAALPRQPSSSHHGHCPPRLPRATTAIVHCGLAACRRHRPPSTRPSPLQPPRPCFPAASTPLLARRSIPCRCSPHALAS